MRFLLLVLAFSTSVFADTPPSNGTPPANPPAATTPPTDCTTMTDAVAKKACEDGNKFGPADCKTFTDPAEKTACEAWKTAHPPKKGLSRSNNNKMEAETNDE